MRKVPPRFTSAEPDLWAAPALAVPATLDATNKQPPITATVNESVSFACIGLPSLTRPPAASIDPLNETPRGPPCQAKEPVKPPSTALFSSAPPASNAMDATPEGRRITAGGSLAVASRELVGREEELASLLDLLNARDELPAVAVVTGDAGIGKTTVWLAAVEAARARGYLVLSCRPAEAEAAFSFVGLADLIGGVVPDVLPELPRPQRRALEAALALSESDGPPAEEGVVAFAFLSTLRKLAADNRLLLAIDDVQWLDAPSLAMLRFALPRLEAEPVAVILTARDEAPLWLRRGVSEARLLRSSSARSASARSTSCCEHASALSFPDRRSCASGRRRAGIRSSRSSSRTRSSDEAAGWIPARSCRFPRIWKSSSTSASIASGLAGSRWRGSLPRSRTRRCAASRGRRPPGRDAGCREAIEARILEVDGERLRFTHPLLRSAVWSRATPAQRRSLHARLAEVAPNTEERARHLALAAVEPSREIAAVLEEAAENAHARGAPAAAAELAELAVRLTPAEDVEDLRRRVLDCADRLREAGDGGRAIALLEQAREAAPPGPARAAVLAHLATRWRTRRPARAIDLFREALAEAEGDPALEAEIHLNLADLVRRREHRGLAHAELAVEAASRAGDAALRCRALATFGFLHFRGGRGIPRERMEEALALERSLPRGPRPAGRRGSSRSSSSGRASSSAPGGSSRTSARP